MDTASKIKKVFGNDAARLRKFLELTKELFASEHGLAEAYYLLAKMEAETAQVKPAYKLSKVSIANTLANEVVQLVENESGRLLFHPETRLSSREASNLADVGAFVIKDGLLTIPFGPSLTYVFLNPQLAAIANN